MHSPHGKEQKRKKMSQSFQLLSLTSKCWSTILLIQYEIHPLVMFFICPSLEPSQHFVKSRHLPTCCKGLPVSVLSLRDRRVSVVVEALSERRCISRGVSLILGMPRMLGILRGIGTIGTNRVLWNSRLGNNTERLASSLSAAPSDARYQAAQEEQQDSCPHNTWHHHNPNVVIEPAGCSIVTVVRAVGGGA